MTTKLKEKLTARWQDALNLLLGLWLAVSPWVLSYAGETMPTYNAVAAGAVIATAAAAALIAFHPWEEWVNAMLSVWLILSPWILGFSGLQAAAWNQVAVGVLVGGLALCSAATTSDSGGLAMKS